MLPPESFDGIALVQVLAQNGDAAHQVRLAKIYETRDNVTEARIWYSKAAEQGNSDAKDALKRLQVQ